MGDKHVVRFEPVGIEIEVDEEQTVLRAAFDQGIMLMHGCKEGQCSSCSVPARRPTTWSWTVLDVRAARLRAGTGFTLLCLAYVYEDVTIELPNYDEEMIRSGLPVQEAVAEVVANDPVTHDMRHLVLKLVSTEDFKFFPGQYVDITVPGTDEVRSFSMANTSARESGQLEFIIKIYPDGLFSGYLDNELKVGDRLTVTGPFGVFTLRDALDTDSIFVGGGAGMAPILCLLRSMAERGIDRKAVYYYGARRRGDLCFEDELRALEQTIPNFRYVPALSDEDWEGENGLITDVVSRSESVLARAHAYVCGPRRWSRPRCRC